MKKILFSLLFISLLSCGSSQIERIKTDIKNTLTERHVTIPGTRVSIIPPPGFIAPTNYTGLQKNNNIQISVVDFDGGNFYADEKKLEFMYTFEIEDHPEAKVLDSRGIYVNGYPARFYSLQNDSTTNSYMLFFGDSTFSVRISSVYPASDKNAGNQILSAFNSICFDKQKKISSLESAYFDLNDKKLKFQFFMHSFDQVDAYLYTIGGHDTRKTDINTPYMALTQFPIDDTTWTINEMNELGRSLFIGAYLEVLTVSSNNKINGCEAIESEMSGYLEEIESNIYIYQCVIVKGDKSLIIQGIAKSEKDFKVNKKDFIQLAHAVQMK